MLDHLYQILHIFVHHVLVLFLFSSRYYSTQVLSTRSDVFSFGVVLLEIVTGREPLDVKRPRHEWSLVEWVSSHCNLQSSTVVIPNIVSLEAVAPLYIHHSSFERKKKIYLRSRSAKIILPPSTPCAGKTIHQGVQDRGDGGPWHKRAVLLRGHVESARGRICVHRALLNLQADHG